MMINTKKREGKASVIVVLKEITASTEKTGVAPLEKALREVVGPEDELLVLTILDIEEPTPSCKRANCCTRYHQNYSPCEDPYSKFLHQEISRRKEAYIQIFTPFYKRCSSNGVKFQVRIYSGFRPKDFIVEEANNAKATRIVMDTCFARDMTFQLSGTNSNVSLVSDEDDEVAMVRNYLPPNDGLESIVVKEKDREPNTESLTLMKELLSQEEPHIRSSLPISRGEFLPFPPSLLESTSRESENPTMFEPYKESGNLKEVEQPTKKTIMCEESGNLKEESGDLKEQPTMSEPYKESGDLKEVEQPTKETVVCEESENLKEQSTMFEPYEESGDLKEVEQPTKETVVCEESGNLKEQPTMSEPYEENGDLKEVEQPTKETVVCEESGNLNEQPTMSEPYEESGNLKEVEQPTKETVMSEESGNLKEQPTMSKAYEESGDLKEVEQPTKETIVCEVSGNLKEESANLKEQPTMSEPYEESGNLKEVGQPTKETVMPEESGNLKEQPTMSTEPYEESGNLKEVEQPTKETVVCDISSRASVVLGLPLKLSGEVIEEITVGFARKYCTYKKDNLTIYDVFLGDHNSFVLVKKFKGGSNGILKAEMKAASSICHKNILKLIGYHKSENTTFLVFPNARNRTLDNYLCGPRRKQMELTFQDKMKIAIETAQGVRYMHEECPQGPIVHGEFLPCNIFLNDDFQPLISGFGQAKWLQVEQAPPISNNRFWPNDPSNGESMDLIKSNIFSFGVLLLRLFCRRSVPQDDKILIEWARPLLLQRAFHELLDEDTEVEDMHGIYRVMSAATQCTRTKPISRPCMSEVISILKGENFCAMQSSPSDNSIEEAEILNGLASLHYLDDIHAAMLLNLEVP